MSDTEGYEPRRAAEPVESDRDLRDADAEVQQQVDGRDDSEQVKADAKRAEGISGQSTGSGLTVEGRDDDLHRDASRLSEEG